MLNPCHPGEILREYLDDAEVSVNDFSARTGFELRAINRVLEGRAAMSPERAQVIERIGWSNADFWIRLQTNYETAQEARSQRAIT